MKKFIVPAATITLATAALTTLPASAHDGVDIKPAGQCDPISQAEWRKVRKGISLEDAEHAVGCQASHYHTHEMKSGTVDSYFFKTGSRSIAEIKIKNGKLWLKLGYHSGL